MADEADLSARSKVPGAQWDLCRLRKEGGKKAAQGTEEDSPFPEAQEPKVVSNILLASLAGLRSGPGGLELLVSSTGHRTAMYESLLEGFILLWVLKATL
jgi:hypothetical protein